MGEPWIEDMRREEKWDAVMARLPRCRECGEPITQERCLRLYDGSRMCPECIRLGMEETVQ